MTQPNPPSAADPAAAALAAASNAFGFDLWSRVRAAPGNLSISPASISIALAMAWGGARGETAAEMKQVLRVGAEADAAMAAWGRLAAALQGPSRSLVLRIANRLFGEQRYQLEGAYLEKTRAAFGAPLEPVDFAGAPEPARAHINQWVADQTEQRIRDLLPPGSIDPATRLVLVNAIYFLADWLNPFEKEATSALPFTVAPGQTRSAMMMVQQNTYRMAKTDGVSVLELPYAGGDAARGELFHRLGLADVLELPYVGGDAAMIIVLPDQAFGLEAVEASLDTARLTRWMQALTSQEIILWLPRFVIDPPAALELGWELQALGMVRAFDRERADFTGIASPPQPADRLFISAVFHKAFVRVDEQGTEAAAATAVVEVDGAAPEPEPVLELKIDHPFLFFIVDRASGLVLFMGRVTDPQSP
ncbi:MAG TPA: serpin family protein [Kofleriaceae bacterium]|nr:serpin family protein [Kofleriaceae bacterium]